ncbi:MULTISPECIES: hypothetical protein [unclassified Sulfitobacter]|uniref:hypothetical protein n=1 Tax=unclassified Sulfitobacter TaxID=196795 RepID=UPI0007C27F05|nr:MULTISPECIES: hypothetical protein [unclassified Sulfitobacter]KZX90390.1 hypothetical protein A3720_10415 [Sulfitobacter sp. HI0021]KZY04216.1 hypothetical protein A3722_19515 [Sulfitobacter sp. HI0027]KZZ01837.1 hypothetical protein A3747_17905 [Sulfitobacter sp. HI0076]
MREWVRLGLSYDDFWRMTLRECDLILTATLAREKADIRSKRVLQQELAHLIHFAVNDPKHMPDFTKDKGEPAAEVMSEREADARLRSFFIGAAIHSKKG